MTDRHFMALALEEALKAAERGEVPVGAVVVLNGEVIAVAGNSPISYNDPTAHAEILALREAARVMGNYRLTGCDLYVTLEPCIMCAGALVHARIRRLIYGAADPKGGGCGSLYNVVEDRRLNHRIEVVRGVEEEQAAELLRVFFRAKRRNSRSGEVPKRS